VLVVLLRTQSDCSSLWAERVASQELRVKLLALADRYPVPEEPVKGEIEENQDPQLQLQREENQEPDRSPEQQPPPSEVCEQHSEDGDRHPKPAEKGGTMSGDAGTLCESGKAGAEAAVSGGKRVRVERPSERAKSKRLKAVGSHTTDDKDVD
jgi:hypothetical protein